MNNETQADRILRALKNHPWAAIAIVLVSFFVGLAHFTEAVDKIWAFAEKRFFSTSDQVRKSAAQAKSETSSPIATPTAPPAIPQKDIRAELALALREAEALSYSADRDTAIKKLIRYGLKKDAPELVTEYVPKLSYSADRDAMYKEIIDHAAKTQRFELATTLVERLSYSADRDLARQHILDARTSR